MRLTAIAQWRSRLHANPQNKVADGRGPKNKQITSATVQSKVQYNYSERTYIETGPVRAQLGRRMIHGHGFMSQKYS